MARGRGPLTPGRARRCVRRPARATRGWGPGWGWRGQGGGWGELGRGVSRTHCHHYHGLYELTVSTCSPNQRLLPLSTTTALPPPIRVCKRGVARASPPVWNETLQFPVQSYAPIAIQASFPRELRLLSLCGRAGWVRMCLWERALLDGLPSLSSLSVSFHPSLHPSTLLLLLVGRLRGHMRKRERGGVTWGTSDRIRNL
eukprot:1053982-Rhodomonas_salina.2